MKQGLNIINLTINTISRIYLCNLFDSKKSLQNLISEIDSYIWLISSSDWLLILFEGTNFCEKSFYTFLKLLQRILNYFAKFKFSKFDSHLFYIPHFYFNSTLKRSLSSRDFISFQNKFWKFQRSKPANTKVVQLVNPNLIFKHISLGNFTVHYMLTITFIRRRWYYLP